MPTHIPQHYNLQQLSIKDASLHLDMYYKQHWRVVQMVVHPSGEQIFVLMEKIVAPAKN